MKNRNFIGIDISKSTLDVCLMRNNQVLAQIQIPNTLPAIRKAFGEFKKRFSVLPADSLCCMEHTGIYNYILIEFLWSKKYTIWLERAIQIKMSIGAVRGKSDKVDAQRIAQYACKNSQDCTPWKPERQAIQQLKALLTTRSRLINIQKQLAVPLRESAGFMDKKILKLNEQITNAPLQETRKGLKKIEREIQSLIHSDDHLAKLFSLVQSVDGVGVIVAANIIVRTNEFKSIRDAKKFACYAGVVPFDHTSGTSTRGRSRVSHMANKSIKTLLHMAALSVIRAKGEMQDYYLRKLQEGKNKMNVLNAIRNKLIARIFAVVNRNEPYQKQYQSPLV